VLAFDVRAQLSRQDKGPREMIVDEFNKDEGEIKKTPEAKGRCRTGSNTRRQTEVVTERSDV